MHKYKNLDGLRGLAALVVVFWHYSLGFLPSFAGQSATHHISFERLFSSTPLHLFFAGPSAVTVFFVLSGFVLSVKFFQTGDSSLIKSSIARRYFRLMIPALGSIIFTYLVLRFGLSYVGATKGITGSGWLGTLWNFPISFGGALWQGIYTTFFGTFTATNWYNFNLWTMKTELLGSFLVFGIMAIFGRMRNRWLVYIVLIIACLKTYYLSFIFGLVIADVWSNYEGIKNILSQKFCWALLPFGLFFFAFYVPPPGVTSIYSHLVIPPLGTADTTLVMQTVGAVIIIIATLRLQLLSRFFESKPLQFLGINSFSLYVLHLAFLGSVACFLFDHLIWRIGYPGAFLASFSITVPITLTAAYFYTKYIDSTAISFSRVIGNAIVSDKSLFSRLPKLRLLQPSTDKAVSLQNPAPTSETVSTE